jgi:hypothetical protein
MIDLVKILVVAIGLSLILIGTAATGLIALGLEPSNPLSVPLVLVSGIALVLLGFISLDKA